MIIYSMFKLELAILLILLFCTFQFFLFRAIEKYIRILVYSNLKRKNDE